MRVAILSEAPDLSAYVGEILRTWGLALQTQVPAEAARDLDPSATPVAICPVMEDLSRHAEALVAYADRGGTLICFLPTGHLAAAAGLAVEAEKDGPLRLRITGPVAEGILGELLPVVGRAADYRVEGEARVLAYLSFPGRYQGETVGISETRVGRGKILTFAFDLPLCVLMLRQGDPARAEWVPPGDGCARPSHLAAEIGPGGSGWIPFADLLGRLLVDMVRLALPGPCPILWHLPDQASSVLLYSGDEDIAPVAANDEEFAEVTAAGGRMNLYLIPEQTHSTPDDIQRYLAHHDLGPHPNLRPLDGRPVAERVAEFERQVRVFEERFGVKPRSVRNHCTAWAGYLDLVEAMEKLGVRMDGNYFSGCYMRDRDPAPYAAFGAAMPMRFCRPDGRLLDVFQQHTHLSDDVMFGVADYSYKLSTDQFAYVASRIFSDCTRLQTPYAVCIHPGNWVRFSREEGKKLLALADDLRLPIWSFDQWLAFWEARDTWRVHDLRWDGGELRFEAEGTQPHRNLSVWLPHGLPGRGRLSEVWLGGDRVPCLPAPGQRGVLVPLSSDRTRVTVLAEYVERE